MRAKPSRGIAAGDKGGRSVLLVKPKLNLCPLFFVTDASTNIRTVKSQLKLLKKENAMTTTIAANAVAAIRVKVLHAFMAAEAKATATGSEFEAAERLALLTTVLLLMAAEP